MPYAAGTDVPVDRSKVEIERTLTRFGADSFGYATKGGTAVIVFEIEGRQVRFTLPLPDRASAEFNRTAQGRPRQAAAAEKAWEQACRERWRALAAVIKAKLVAVEAGISTVEQEFLAWVALPDGTTVGESVAPSIEKAYSTGRVAPLLALGKGA